MSRRRGGHGQSVRQIDSQDSRRIVERLLEKKQYKDALKQAKLGYRQDASAENRQLLERTTLLRTQDLARRGLQIEAKETAGQLLELGVLDSQVLAELLLLLPRVGLGDKAVVLQAKLTSPDMQATLTARRVDQAVLHPDEADVTPELGEQSQRVRSALSALDAGNEEEALNLFRDIPRGSPLADWRYFVRGLAAFRRGSHDQAIANWDRLEPTRAAHSIASQLRRTLPPEGSTSVLADLSRLEAAVFGDTILIRLQRLQRAIDESDWDSALKVLPSLSDSLRRGDTRFAHRLTEILLPVLSQEARSRYLDDAQKLVALFTRAVEPLPFDPNWNRFWALMWEQFEEGLSQSIESWERYLRDLENVTCPLPVERHRIQALVWRHIAELLIRDLAITDNPFDEAVATMDVEKIRSRAVQALQTSLKLDPSQRETHELLMNSYVEWEQPDHAAMAAQDLLQAFPDDYASLKFLMDHFQSTDEPDKALPYIQRARSIKPLDQELIGCEWWAHMARARHHALKKEWDAGRAALDHAQSIDCDYAKGYLPWTRRAIFEFKAKQLDAAEESLRKAEALAPDEAALWLVLQIEAARYKLPGSIKARFEKSWLEVLKRKVTSKAAGTMAAILDAYRNVKYPGRDSHQWDVIAYLRRTTRMKYEEPDLIAVCSFLLTVGDEEEDLLQKLLNRGLKQFPKSAPLYRLAATVECSKGPFQCDVPRAKKLLSKALSLAEMPGSACAEMVPDIKKQLSLLGDLQESMQQMPFAFPGAKMPFLPGQFQEFLQTMFEQGELPSDEDEDEFFGIPFFGREPRREPQRTRKGKS